MSSTLTARKVVRMIKLRLDEILKERGLTLKWLEEQTGIRYATLFNIKENNVEKINLNYLAAIMTVLEIDDMNEMFIKTV